MGHVWSQAKGHAVRITNTDRKSQSHKVTKSPVQRKRKNPYFCLTLPTFYFLLFTSTLLTGCIQKTDLQKAQDYASRSADYYQRSADFYQKLIAQGKDLDRLNLELGKLYFAYGDLEQAAQALGKSRDPQAQKFLGLAYYRLGKFSDALEVFSKIESPDSECRYYHALTCEKLNLFDQAIGLYKNIEDPAFKCKASERIGLIERQAVSGHISQISPQIDNILSAAPAVGDYPQAGALILSCDEKIEITAEGAQISYLHYVVKILNERGKEDFAETAVDYDSTFEKIELEYARTIKPDGTVVEVGSRHIRDVSKYLNFPLYSNVRVCIISFPEITEGATIEYKLKVYRSQLINKKDFFISYPVQSSQPIIAASFSISLPKDKPLHLKVVNERYNDFGANLKPNQEEKDGFLVYSWKFQNIPQIMPESNMPPQSEINPSILISTFNSWQEIYDWWSKLAQDKIKADAVIKNKVLGLTRQVSQDEAKIRAIYNFCAQKIRYVAVEYGQAGFEPHQAEDIFRNKYGDCKDKAILLVTMLRDAGFSAWPVLIGTKECYNTQEDFPTSLFNHVIVAVSVNARLVFLDPTAETCAFDDLPQDDQQRKVLVVKQDGYQLADTPLYPAEHNLMRQDFKVKVNNDESITAEKSINTYGIYDQMQRYWLLYTAPELIRESLKEKIQEFSIGAKLETYNIANLDDLNRPLVLSYKFTGGEYFTYAGGLRIMPQLFGLDTSLVAKDKRRYAIELGILDSKETIFEIEIPANFAITYIPDNVDEESPWVNCSADYKHEGNKIYFRQKVRFKKNAVLQEEYQDFKAFFEMLAKRLKQRIVLEKIR